MGHHRHRRRGNGRGVEWAVGGVTKGGDPGEDAGE